MPIRAGPYKQCVDNKRILQSFDAVRYRYRYLVKNFLEHKFLLYLFINNEGFPEALTQQLLMSE